MSKLKLLSSMIIIAMLASSIAGCTDGNNSEVSSGEQVSIESSADESKNASLDDTPLQEYVNLNAYTDEWGSTKNKTVTIQQEPPYFANFTKKDSIAYFYFQNDLECSYEEEGYVRFKPTNADPFLCIEKPTCPSEKMRYIRIEYRASESTVIEMFVNRSDGILMGQEGTHITYNLKKCEEFQSIIIDITSVCSEGVYFTDLRIDTAAANGIIVDIKYIAGFETSEDAENFEIENLQKGRVNSTNEVEWDDPEYVVQSVSDLDNYEGTLEMTDNGDGTVTISYVKDGKTVSHTVPDNANYVSGGYAATDDLRRSVPDSNTVGVYGENGEYYVGMFYFLWLGEHGDTGVYDINKIIMKYGTAAQSLSCGAWGGDLAWHFWGEPLYGYYYSRDEWVIRKHMELFSNANIDFLYLDATNGFTYIDNAKLVMEVCHDLNKQGYDAPQIIFYSNGPTAKDAVRSVYDEIYSQNWYPDTWFLIDGKPVIVSNEEENIDNFFTTRSPQWPLGPINDTASWPWIDFNWPQLVYLGNEGVGESISVSVAQHNGNTCFSSAFYGDTSNRGRSTVGQSETVSSTAITKQSYKFGYNFKAQWDRVFECINNSATDPAQNIKYVLVTGWNEWVAQRQAPGIIQGQEITFIDLFNPEYSRDIEMTRGLYFDNYYMQLIQNVYKLKGAAPVIIQDSRKAINVTGDFDQWNSVKVTYTDPQNDCDDREQLGFGKTEYLNQTGRNDIVSAKVTSDTKNLYFYVETTGDISMYDTDSAWMQLFVNTDSDGLNGWYGYDYVINHEAKSQFTTTVSKVEEKRKSNTYNYKTVGEVSYRVKDNKMMIAVPLEMLGISDYNQINVEFKWADSTGKISNMEAFYELGDSAPLGRLNYVYRNY